MKETKLYIARFNYSLEVLIFELEVKETERQFRVIDGKMRVYRSTFRKDEEGNPIGGDSPSNQFVARTADEALRKMITYSRNKIRRAEAEIVKHSELVDLAVEKRLELQGDGLAGSGGPNITGRCDECGFLSIGNACAICNQRIAKKVKT